MTRPVAQLSGLIVIVWALVLAAVPALGARLPDRTPWPEVGFGVCELPCWSNITPGQTPFSDVVPLLNTTLPSDSRLLVSGSQVDFWTQTGDRPLYGYLYFAAGSVGNISMHAELTVGKMVHQLGTPDCLYLESVDNGGKLFAVYWETPNGMVGALVPSIAGRWGPTTQTATLFLASPQPACNRNKATAWRGFAPFSRYQTMSGVR